MTAVLETTERHTNNSEKLYTPPTYAELEARQAEINLYVPEVEHEYIGKLAPLVDAEIVHTENNPAHSFKARGGRMAFNRALERGERYLVTSSAGNHSQGLALPCGEYDELYPGEVHLTVFMPADTPMVKQAATSRLGGNAVTVVTDQPDFAKTTQAARQFTEETGACYVSPYDNPDVIAGQGTAVLEALNGRYDIDKVFLNVGGGGELAGGLEVVATAKSEGKLNPDCKVVAVMPEGNDSLEQTLAAGGVPTPATNLSSLCEGSCVPQIGDLTAERIWYYREHLELVKVTAAEVGETAVAFEDRTQYRTELGVEPYDRPETTGLLPEAGMRKLAAQHEAAFKLGGAPETWLALCTGSNVDPTKWQTVKDAYEETLVTVEQPAPRALGRSACRVASSPAYAFRLQN